MSLKIHPALEAFPRMSPEARALLVEDIRIHGQRVPILCVGSVVVDGRERLDACQELGTEPKLLQVRDPYAGAAFSGAASIVASANLIRRHLTSGQVAMIAARLVKFGLTYNRAEILTGSGYDRIKTAEEVLERAEQDVIARVDEGTMSITQAASRSGRAAPARPCVHRVDEAPSFDDLDDLESVVLALAAIGELPMNNQDRLRDFRALSARARVVLDQGVKR